jgi:hypothetical protein
MKSVVGRNKREKGWGDVETNLKNKDILIC